MCWSSDDDRARGPQPADHLGILVRVFDLSVSAEPGGRTRDVDVVFDGDRDSQQWKFLSRCAFAVGGRRVGQCTLAQHHPERVERRLAGVDGVK